MVTGLTIIAGLFHYIVLFLCVLWLLELVSMWWSQIYTHMILLKNHIDLTKMVQKPSVFTMPPTYSMMSTLTSHLQLINPIDIIPCAAFETALHYEQYACLCDQFKKEWKRQCLKYRDLITCMSWILSTLLPKFIKGCVSCKWNCSQYFVAPNTLK